MRSGLPALLLAFAVVAGCGHGDVPAEGTGAATADSTESPAEQGVTADEVERVTVAQARERVQAGQALLVCAYEGEERFQQNALEGAIASEAFAERLPSLTHQQEIIFYCG